jgi:hypothetical protein
MGMPASLVMLQKSGTLPHSHAARRKLNGHGVVIAGNVSYINVVFVLHRRTLHINTN